MKRSLKMYALSIFIIYSLNSFGQIKLTQKTLTAGSEKCVINNCYDTCIIVYKSYTVNTHPHHSSCGEDIIITDNNIKSKTFIDVKDEYKAQYFSGIIDDKVIIDVGTGSIRTFFIYDLKVQRLIDSLNGIIDEPIVVGDKLYYSIMMNNEKVKRLNLPKCDNPNLEISGYVEFMYYDLKNRKVTSSGKYKCIN